MKKISLALAVVAMCALLCVGLSGCGSSSSSSSSSSDKKLESVDYDLTAMSADEAYTIMGALYNASSSTQNKDSEYLNKTFKITGTIGRISNSHNGTKYYQCRLNQSEKNSEGKSSYGPYIWLEGKTLADAKDSSDEYPKQGSKVTVAGTFKTIDNYLYSENVPLNALYVTASNYEVIESK